MSDRDRVAALTQGAHEAVTPYLVRELRDRVRLRSFPRVSSVYDEALETADRVYKILSNLEHERETAQEAAAQPQEKVKSHEDKKTRVKN